MSNANLDYVMLGKRSAVISGSDSIPARSAPAHI